MNRQRARESKCQTTEAISLAIDSVVSGEPGPQPCPPYMAVTACSRDGAVGPGRAELAAAMGSLSVVVGLVLGQDQPQMPFAGDQHPVGDLGSDGEHEPFRKSVDRIVNDTPSR